jgi:dienelactone hydrolase
MKVSNLFQSMKFTAGIFIVLLFLGALFWAKEQDPFSRQWFALKTADNGLVKCAAVLPKPIRPCPVIIYTHGSGGSLINDGSDLRQIAELGLAVVSVEYDQTNETAFEPQFETLLHYLGRQRWANTKATAWVGFSLGANRLLDFVEQHPEQAPQLLVLTSGAGLPEGQTNSQLELLHCPVLLIHGNQDKVFPLADTRRLASTLQTNGVPVELKIIPGVSHSMEPERGVIFRGIGEYCLSRLISKDCWQNYHSNAQWQAEAPSLWLFWLPAAMWAIGCFVWTRHRKEASPEKNRLTRSEGVLRWLAVFLATWALSETAIHLVTPHFLVSDRTLSLARRFLVQPKERVGFEYLATQSIWHEQKLQTLLEHVELARYNRELINWQVDDKTYRDFVLSPVIIGNADEQLNWRRPLWEEFYPCIRHESSPEDAARIVVRHLRERVTIAAAPNLPHDVPAIWLQQITDETGFEIIYVAALRSVGVPARLDATGHVEFWNGTDWRKAPIPLVMSWK